jgi:hypothetical protein
MAGKNGGARPGAGRPKGSTTVPQFRDYVTEGERQAFVAWVLRNYKKNPRLATWVGDQIFSKAPQTAHGR